LSGAGWLQRHFPAGGLWAALCLLALLSGCAEQRAILRFDPSGAATTRDIVWPGPPERARYRYIGELYGQQNYFKEKAETREGVKAFLYWVAGLLAGEEQPIVLQRPLAGAVDEQGRIFVTDASRGAVFVFDAAKNLPMVWESAGGVNTFVSPTGIAIGAGGQVLVADAGRGVVVRLDRDGNPLGDIGKGVLTRPTGVAWNPERKWLYVADTHGHDVKVFDEQGQLLETIGHRGEGDGEFNFPTHLVFAGGQLYVTDTMNNRIQVFSGDGQFVRKFGQQGLYLGNLVRPKGVAVDDEGHIYVVESYFDHLLVFDRDGQFLLPIGGTGPEIGQFYLPAGVWMDRNKRVYVADMFNGRVVMFQFLGEL
jgi:DNA-binding beta-propeller fold protein YncE